MLKRLCGFLLTSLFLTSFSVSGLATPPESALPSANAEPRIFIRTQDRMLFFYDPSNGIQEFSIAVGREGRKWSGETSVSRKVLLPKWVPPPAVRKDNPGLPTIVGPGPDNPLGAAVLVLGDGTYGIHGNNNPALIGTDASYGCFRMYNADILFLLKEVRIGTKVTVVP
jgi:lipoprotein-anchoring transpeptidase ErfK/SrfK